MLDNLYSTVEEFWLSFIAPFILGTDSMIDSLIWPDQNAHFPP